MRQVLIVLLSMLAWSGCRRGSCEGITCLNGGTCRGGRCDCPVGFEGDRCQIKSTDRWVGTYTVDDRCRAVGLIPQYEGRITASTVYPDVIYLESFGDLRCEGQPVKVEARLNTGTLITITRQALCNRRYSVEGSGQYDGNGRQLRISYYITDYQIGLTDTCEAVWIKY